MIEQNEKTEAQFRRARILAVVTLVACPLIYLLIAYYAVDSTVREGGEQQMLLYILLLVALAEPALVPVIERFRINEYRGNPNSSMTPAQLFTAVSIIKFAFVEAAYIFGFVVYILSGDIIKMLYFYPVGIVWSFVYWPRKATFERFVKRVRADEPFVPRG